MQEAVIVTANPETGKVVNESSNPEKGYIRVEQMCTEFVNSFMVERKRTALIHGDIKALEKLNWPAGKVLKGKLVFREKLEPFWDGQAVKIQPGRDGGENLILLGVDPKTGELKPIYRNTIYTEDMSATDQVIEIADKVAESQYGRTVESVEELESTPLDDNTAF